MASGSLPMITAGDQQAPAGGAERCVDRHLWLACAGRMCTVPPVGDIVYYFPQGHAEHAAGPAGLFSATVDLSAARVLVHVLCRVTAVRYMADPETDEVFARILLIPLPDGVMGAGLDDDAAVDETKKPASFAKTLTQPDIAYPWFLVPEYIAETIFPPLNYDAKLSEQTLVAKDVHGTAWKFQHSYRKRPLRHQLATGWSTFVRNKRLFTGDSIVFLRGDGGDLHIGIRRAKSEFCGAGMGRAKVMAEDLVEAARLASAGQPFEVAFYPCLNMPEFCVRAKVVHEAMRVPWSPGMRFKMAFETDDSSQIIWFTGTVTGVKVADPVRWPQSLWRLLEVTWDRPERLRNVKRVSPWLVEVVSSMPDPSFLPPRKKPRSVHPEFPFDGQLLNSAFPPNPLPHSQPPRPYFLNTYPSLFPFPSGSAPAAMQGARHAQSVPSLPDYLTNLPSSLLYPGSHRPTTIPEPAIINTGLTIGANNKKPEKPAGIRLFGQIIQTEEQMSLGSSSGATSPAATTTSSLNWNAEKGANVSECSGSGVIQNSSRDKASSERQWSGDGSSHLSDLGLGPGQCEVFMESDTVGRNLDLSSLTSFDEFYHRLSEMFGIESAALRSRVIYRDATGAVKHIGDGSFSDLVRSARRLTILTDAGAGRENLG